jgi:hypothetical protein
MPLTGLRKCPRCSIATLPNHRGESKVDGAQHYDLRCGNGHLVQLHYRVDPPTSDPLIDRIEPIACPSHCEFYVTPWQPR